MDRPAHDNALLQAAEFAQADHLLKQFLIAITAGIIVGIALYVLVGLRAGA